MLENYVWEYKFEVLTMNEIFKQIHNGESVYSFPKSMKNI